MSVQSLLYVENLTVSFEGFLALNNLTLIIDGNEKIRLLVGPNGAGKTTLFDVLTGRVSPVHGRVIFNDTLQPLQCSEHDIVDMGILRKFQTPAVFPRHTVFENMMLSSASKRLLSKSVFRSSRQMPEDVMTILEKAGLLAFSRVPAGVLSHGQQQWLEIAMLLAQSPRLLLLDEPVAGMSRAEKDRTAELLQQIVQEHECTVIVIEHDMEFVRKIASHGHNVAVLHEGKMLSEGSIEKVQSDEQVIQAYLGRSMVKESRN